MVLCSGYTGIDYNVILQMSLLRRGSGTDGEFIRFSPVWVLMCSSDFPIQKSHRCTWCISKIFHQYESSCVASGVQTKQGQCYDTFTSSFTSMGMCPYMRLQMSWSRKSSATDDLFLCAFSMILNEKRQLYTLCIHKAFRQYGSSCVSSVIRVRKRQRYRRCI